jgi:hypothetical protein
MRRLDCNASSVHGKATRDEITTQFRIAIE